MTGCSITVGVGGLLLGAILYVILKLLLLVTLPPLLAFSCDCWLLLFELEEAADDKGAAATVARFGRISILMGIEFVVVALAAGAECSLVSFGGGSRPMLVVLLESSSDISL